MNCAGVLAVGANQDQSGGQFLLLRPVTRRYRMCILSSSVSISDHITTLGVTLDSNLTFNKPVSSVCKSAYYSVRALRHIRPVLTCHMSRDVSASFTQTHLDFANSVPIRNFGSNMSKLQHIQNCLARVVLKTITVQLPPSCHNFNK